MRSVYINDAYIRNGNTTVNNTYLVLVTCLKATFCTNTSCF